MTKHDKLWSLIFLGLGAAGLLLLAFLLPHLELHPGQSFSLGKATPVLPGQAEPLSSHAFFIFILQGLLALGLVLLAIYVLINLMTAEGRRRLLADLLVIAVLVLALEFISRHIQEIGPLEAPAQSQSQNPGFSVPGGPVAQFTANTSPWSDVLVMVGVALLVAVLAAIALGVFRRRASIPEKQGPLDQLAQEAQEAAEAIQAGANIKDIVIRSYIQMSRILYEERGIQRETAMTPSEFQLILEEKGFPRQPVHNLTHLFEMVRYGSQPPGVQEEQQAISSLNAITIFCKSQEVSS